MPVAINHPANAGILAYLGSPERRASSASAARDRPDCAPGEVAQPEMTLGAHPDLVARLWQEIPARLPKDCRRIAYGTPVLCHPESGVIFAFGGGTHTYALRLPEAERAEALAAGAGRIHRYPAYPQIGIAASALDLEEIGPEWVFGGWLPQEPAWCRAAYRWAGEAARR
ncbi:MAG: hypothetical protein IT210_06855 [Armatimonadetes bacterium]|nr:hypothetical protein [Armatimonadota bacterium]